MSLSRPIKFPLLKLPFLCIENVIKKLNIFEKILFALISKKTRQIVKCLKIPLNGIRIFLSDQKWITLSLLRQTWFLGNEKNFKKSTFVMRTDAIPLYTRITEYGLKSYTDFNEVVTLKMIMEFLTEVFKCSVEKVDVDGGSLPESGDIGVKYTLDLYIDHHSSRRLDYAQSQKLNFLLANLEVTGICSFWLTNTGRDFYCDPKLFKCKKLVFGPCSAAWVTREILLQFEVPRLTFYACPFSEEDIAAFVTHWFHSDNRTIEYLYIEFEDTQISLETFQTKELNTLPFSERNRIPITEPFEYIDFSKGLEIVRHDGLQATIHVTRRRFIFYIWHDQPAI